MSALLRYRFGRTALLAAGIGLAGAHAPALATPDLSIVAETCPQAGRNPLALATTTNHSCGVSSPDDFTTEPSWRKLKLQCRDPSRSGGRVVARLYSRSRTTGKTELVTSVPCVPSTSVTVVSRSLPRALDFSLFAYFIRITVATSPDDAPAEATMVMLTNK